MIPTRATCALPAGPVTFTTEPPVRLGARVVVDALTHDAERVTPRDEPS